MDVLLGHGVSLTTAAAALAAIVLVPTALFIKNLIRQRMIVRRVIAAGKPCPPHSFLMGHLLNAQAAFDSLPPGAHSQYALYRAGEAFAARGAWYFDTWPMFHPVLFVVSPHMADQLVAHPVAGARKPAALQKWMRDIAGGPSLFDINGPAWQHLREVVQPCFSSANIAAEMPSVVANLGLFQQILRQKAATGERFELERLTKNMVIDNNGNLILSTKLDVQTQPHPLAEAMIYTLQIKEAGHSLADFLRACSPANVYRRWANDRMLNRELRAFLTGRFDELRDMGAAEKGRTKRSVMDQLLGDYMARHPAATTPDDDFLAMAIRNLRTFFFVSYDSTAAAMVACVLLLWKHPAALAQLRAEHDRVLGPNPATAADQLLANPAVLNSLPYTAAVLKETLRLYPPAQTLREGHRDLVLRNPATGEEFPTDGFAVQVLHIPLHGASEYWVRADEFLPERWLAGPDDPLYPRTKSAWRVFESGPRMCMGQQLVTRSIEAMLVGIAREFDFEECYEEVFGSREGMDLSGVQGRKVYMVEAGAAHPLGGYPCRVKLRQ